MNNYSGQGPKGKSNPKEEPYKGYIKNPEPIKAKKKDEPKKDLKEEIIKDDEKDEKKEG
jgi:hypothetical protein